MNDIHGRANAPPADSQPASQSQWIGLALSGGGFRATLFHLGLVRALRDCGLLERVRLICSVSGGSILAAHMALNWDDYTAADEEKFDKAARDVIKFTKLDLRYRLLRRWIGALVFPLPVVVHLRLFGLFKLTKLLQHHYDRLFEKATFKHLQNLKDRPEIRILATSLTTGRPCIFSNFKFEVTAADRSRRGVAIDSPKISLAVAASSGYPVLFPGVRIDSDTLGSDSNQFSEIHYLTDGGVFDNLGVEELIHATANRAVADTLLIVSDASFNFDRTTKRYSSVMSIPRSLRANDIMMHQLGELRMLRLENHSPKLHRIGMQDELAPDDKNAAPPLTVQRAVRNIETDFKPASNVEVDALLRHGQSKAREKLRRLGACPSDRPLWLPVGDHRKKFDRQHFDKLLKWLKRGRSLRLALSDWVTWAILLWLAFLLWLPRYYYGEKVGAIGQAQKAANYTIQVVDNSGYPISNAKVSVQLEDVANGKYEDHTNEQGYVTFRWGATAGKLWVRVTVEASGFRQRTDEFGIKPGSPHPIQLFE
jgi:predicted acylesterase/phospholipase RssA